MELYEIRTSGSGEGLTDNGGMTDCSGEQQVSQRKYPEAVLLVRHNPPTPQSSRSLRSQHSPTNKTYDNKEMKIINDNKI